MENLPREEIRLTLVADAIRRRWPLIIAPALLLGAAVGAFATSQPATYTSTADVLLNPIPGNALTVDSARSGQQITVAMQTEAGLVKSPPVADLVSDQVGETVRAGASGLTVSVPANTQIVRVQYSGNSADRAQAYAQAYAESLLVYRENQATDTTKAQLAQLEKQADSATSGLTKASKAAAVDDPPADVVAQVQLFANRLATLQDQIGSLEAEPVAPGALVTPATAASARDGLDPWVFTLAGGLLGLVLGLTIAVWRERADDRLRARVEISVGSVPVLGLVPAGLRSGSGLIVDESDDQLLDAYRTVRAATLALSRPPSVLAISAVDESLTTIAPRVAINLAASIAVSQHRVCLVDATLGDTHVAQMLGMSPRFGLADALRVEGSEMLTPFEHAAGFDVVAGGTTPLTARELLASSRFESIIRSLSAQYEYVVVAAPPANLSESSHVALAATAMVVVAAEARSRREQVRHVSRRANQLGVELLGIVAVSYRRREKEPLARGAHVKPASPRRKINVDSAAEAG